VKKYKGFVKIFYYSLRTDFDLFPFAKKNRKVIHVVCSTVNTKSAESSYRGNRFSTHILLRENQHKA